MDWRTFPSRSMPVTSTISCAYCSRRKRSVSCVYAATVRAVESGIRLLGGPFLYDSRGGREFERHVIGATHSGSTSTMPVPGQCGSGFCHVDDDGIAGFSPVAGRPVAQTRLNNAQSLSARLCRCRQHNSCFRRCSVRTIWRIDLQARRRPAAAGQTNDALPAFSI